MPAEENQPIILVTGGTGYIGSHTVIELLAAGYNVLIVDNLSNSCVEALTRIKLISKCKVEFRHVDLLDAAALEQVFCEYDAPDGTYSLISAVIHFAALKAVGESVIRPLEYYQNNISGSITLMRTMERHRVRRLIYSSSATVYGDSAIYPIHEECPTAPTSPYGHSKLFTEQIIADTAHAHGWQAIILRYFNPVGAHPSALLGEHPRGTPNNLMPYLAQVAIGRLNHVTVFGRDYFTHDGSGVRDYIHVVDLARGHVAALDKLNQVAPPGHAPIYNLGSGRGTSVFEMIRVFSQSTGMKVPFEVGDRRPGDVATLLADPQKANKQLEWHAELSLAQMCQDLWRWQSNNPNGLDRPETD